MTPFDITNLQYLFEYSVLESMFQVNLQQIERILFSPEVNFPDSITLMFQAQIDVFIVQELFAQYLTFSISDQEILHQLHLHRLDMFHYLQNVYIQTKATNVSSTEFQQIMLTELKKFDIFTFKSVDEVHVFYESIKDMCKPIL